MYKIINITMFLINQHVLCAHLVLVVRRGLILYTSLTPYLKQNLILLLFYNIKIKKDWATCILIIKHKARILIS